MKKILLATILSVLYFTSASAEIGVNVGLSGQMGLFAASAEESHTDTTSSSSTTFKNSDTEVAAVGYSSFFIEKTLGERLAIGVDYVMSGLSSDTVESTKVDGATTADQATDSHVTNKVQIDFEDLTTIYLAFNVTENMYVKAGAVTVDVNTNESLGTGSSYGNTSLDGTALGVGYNKTFDNTMFVRVEGNYIELDGATMSSNDNKITLDGIDGVTGKISVGKSF